MVFQSYALYPHKSVGENLAFGLRVRHVPAAEIDARVRQTAAVLGIETLLDRRPAQLSGGQRQRVALGRAIVREPQAFLLDEPLSNLDPQTRASIRTELALLHRRLGATMVYVTHDQEEAMTLGTRVAVMRDGRVEQLAPPLDLFRRPANAFVASFIGAPAMNLLHGTWSAAGRTVHVGSPAFALEPIKGEPPPGPAPDANGGGAPARVLVGIRPDDIELTRPGEGHGAGRVEVVEPLGSTTLVHLRAEGLGDRLLRAIVRSDAAVDVNAAVGFRIDLTRLHLFDEGTGRRLGQRDTR
jgi:ABC-type sugar transport system ATPase subunit